MENNNKNLILTILVIILILVAGFFVFQNRANPPVVTTPNENGAENAAEENTVRNLVTNFGEKLKDASLLSPTAAEEIEANYASFVIPELIATWKADPENAPGRLTSSPWPENIEIESATKVTLSEYIVLANVIEMTSQEEVTGGEFSETPVVITVKNIDGEWLISDFSTTSTAE